MPKGMPLHTRRCGVKPVEPSAAGHPEKYREEGPICGSSLIDLEAKLAAIKPKVTSDDTNEPRQEN